MPPAGLACSFHCWRVLRIWPVFVLGRRFSGLVAIQPGHTLGDKRIYGIIRHPSYLGLLVGALGWSLAFRSVVGVLLMVLTVPVILSASALKKRCCTRSSARSMMPSAPVLAAHSGIY